MPPGGAYDGSQSGVDAAYFSGSIVYAWWSGFVDVTGVVASYRVALTANGASIEDWVEVGLRNNWAFMNASLVQGWSYQTHVVAVDVAGWSSPVVSSTGQVYDVTPPIVPPTSPLRAAEAAQQERNLAGQWNTKFASQASFIAVRCPQCEDDESGVTEGGCVLSRAADADSVDLTASGFDADVTLARSGDVYTPSIRLFGSAWSSDRFLLGLRQPLADAASYVVTCMCYNGAGEALRAPSPAIATDFTVPTCAFTVPSYVLTDVHSVMDVQWSCEDTQSGLRAVTWAVGSAAGAGDVVPATAAQLRGSDVDLSDRPSSAASTESDLGTSTLAEQLELASMPPVSWLSGRVYFVTLGVTNNAGLSVWYTGPGVLVDFTPPVVKDVQVTNAVTVDGAAYVGGAEPLEVSPLLEKE